VGTRSQPSATSLSKESLTSDQTLLAVLDSTSQGIIIIDRAGSIVLSNNSASAMFGYEKSELLELTVEYLIPKPLRDRHAAHREGYFNRPYVRPMGVGLELSARRKDRSEFPVEISLSYVETDAGHLAIAFITDVSEQRRLEAEVLQSHKMEAIGRLSGGVAHDFRNMLTIIAGNNHLLLDELALIDTRRDYAVEIRKATDRAIGLANQLLAFSRQQVMKLRPLNLNDMLAEARKMLRRLIGEDIQVMLSLSCELGSVKADPGQLEQVMFNLAANARDAMPQGGRLTIETGNFELDEDYAHTHFRLQAGHYVLWAVSDTGCGMDPETKRRIFEPFFTTKEQGKGTGLGLSTVYGIVKQSGGEILVYSEKGRGTTFKIYLPRIEGEKQSIAPQSERPIATGTETILLVEDERGVRKVIANMLEQGGFQVLSARDPLEALALIHEYPGEVHLLLTDVLMPHMNGSRLAELISERRPQIRIVFMSGYTENAMMNQDALDPKTVFLSKPFSKESLRGIIRSVLDQP